MTAVPDVGANVREVRERIFRAALDAGRRPEDVTLVAATKTVAVERIAAALAAGVTDVGENRAQELLAKATELAAAEPGPRWHFLGAVQRNKVRGLASWVSLWHAVDREAAGTEIARRAPGARVLIEVNLAGEPTKAGVAPDDVAALVDALRGTDVGVEGLMTIPPMGEDARPWFARLRDLATPLELSELSMGMTDDYEAAIAEGATIVRIGRALFGPRPPR